MGWVVLVVGVVVAGVCCRAEGGVIVIVTCASKCFIADVSHLFREVHTPAAGCARRGGGRARAIASSKRSN